jgi:hypothetical protein
MGRLSKDIKFIDLKHSKVRWKESDPENGEYIFEPNGKSYIDYNSDASALPDHKVQWCRNDKYDIDRWKYNLDYDFVTWGEKHYWPEGIVPNEAGHYVFKDLILMQCPAMVYAERKKRELDKAEGARKVALDKFAHDTNAAGVGMTKQQLADALGR